MNQENCMRSMDECVVNACEQMKTLNPEDRFHLLLEMGEWIYNPISEEIDEVLIVPDFEKKK
tara:strand:+ start:781 stop:966 length:186 start_codon:yes stop_codon:yes gene_type:complete